MTKHKVVTTDAQIDAAIERAASLADEPSVLSVEYRSGRGLDLLILQMSDGHRCVLPREDLQGLQHASREQISQIEILGNGTGLHWPALDVDLYVPALLQGIYGTRQWMAKIGRSGGSTTSTAKRRSSQLNGKLGGRPKRAALTRIAAIIGAVCFVCLHASAQKDCPVPRPDAKYTGHLQRGQLLEHSNPPYPGGAKSHGISGMLVFRAHILEDGTVGHLTPLSGPPELQEAAERTLYQWRYSPWTINGQSVDAFTSIPVNFEINPSLPSSQKPVAQKIPPLTLQGLLIRSYPAKRSKEAEKANIFGTVQLHITVDEKGRIADLGVVCGSEALDDAALETVRHWKYQPYLSNGQPVAVESTVDVNF